MKIVVQFIDKLSAGGKERQCVELVRFLAARGDYTVYVVTMEANVFYTELETLPGVHIVHMPRYLKRDPTVFWRFLLLCWRLRPAAITAWHPMTAIFALPAAWLLRIKLMSAIIQDAPRELAPVMKRRTALIFALSDSIVGNSAAGIRIYQPPAEKTALIYSAYDLARLNRSPDPDYLRREFAIHTPYVVGMVAAFSEFKDQPTLIAAAGIVLAQRNDVTFVMIGGGPTLPACRALVSPALAPNIRITGEVAAPTEDLVAGFDIGVLITFTEGISNSIMEYMILAKPVVATDGGGTSELVLDGETGLLVPPADAAAVAAAVLRLLDNQALRRAMGAHGRRRVETEFSGGHVFARYCAEYDRLIAGERIAEHD